MDKITDVDIININHMDMANQINNKWERDTILAFVNKEKDYGYAIRLKNRDKSIIRKRFINQLESESTRRHNNKVINVIFAYMIFQVIQEMKVSITKLIICPDHRPSREVHHYIQKIANFLGRPNITGEINISFINRKRYDLKRKTPAHKLATRVLKGKKKAQSFVQSEELANIISKLL
jgi:hypothetical protein